MAMIKTKVKLTGLYITTANVFSLAGEVWKILNDADMPEQAAEFVKKLSECQNAKEALSLVNEYVDFKP